MNPIWKQGDPSWRSHVESQLEQGATEVIAESARRRLLAVSGPKGERWIVKHFLPRPWRRQLAERFVGPAARREWRTLDTLHAASVPVPQALGLAQAAANEWWLVMSQLPGTPLLDLIDANEAIGPAVWPAIGNAVFALHSAGHVHGDLHVGNVIVGPEGAGLVDFQAARAASSHAKLVDVAGLHFSLTHHGVSRSARAALVQAALGVTGDATQRALRDVAQASRKVAGRYYASRTRRCLFPGRQYARIRSGPFSGMRLVEFAEADVFDAVAQHREAVAGGGPAVLKCDHRGRASAVRAGGLDVVVKEVKKGGVAKQLADRFRGSPGQRAWLGGHGLHARGVGVARPFAFVERRTLAGPTESLVVLEDLRPARPAGAFMSRGAGDERSAAIGALASLVTRLHESGADHGDLQAHHIFMERDEQGLRAALIDLEGLRFPRRLRDGQRLKALAELNASLADDLMTPAERRRAFRRYATSLPFGEGAERTLERIVAQSLARKHLWQGRNCEAGEGISPAEP